MQLFFGNVGPKLLRSFVWQSWSGTRHFWDIMQFLLGMHCTAPMPRGRGRAFLSFLFSTIHHPPTPPSASNMANQWSHVIRFVQEITIAMVCEELGPLIMHRGIPDSLPWPRDLQNWCTPNQNLFLCMTLTCLILVTL